MPIPSLFTGAIALTSQQDAISVIANNIANVNTNGFKSSRIHFADQTYNILKPASSPGATRGGTNPTQVGTGTKLADVNTSFAQGALKNTGQATDLAISGNGFFVVSGSMSIDSTSLVNPQYSRDGHFQIDSEGNLTTALGDKVVGATLYDTTSGNIKSISGYSAISYFTDQDVGSSMSANDGLGGNPPVPTPSNTNGAGGNTPALVSGKISEIAVRGGLVDQNTSVTTGTQGDLEISRLDDGKLRFTYDDANAGTSASTFTADVDTNQQFLDGVISFEMQNASGAKVQLRIRLEPGITDLEDVFTGIEYDASGPTSDTLTLRGADTATQAGTEITAGDADFEHMKLGDIRSLYSTINLPSFFHAVDPNVEVATGNFSISADGSVSLFGTGSEEMKLGRLLIANFTNADGLSNVGNNKFEETSNSGFAGVTVIGGPEDKNAPSVTGSQMVSGALESSNVNLANEFAELIGFQRGLQASARTVSASDEILQTLINL